MQTHEDGMQHRLAAQILIEKILADHESRPPQSRLAKLFGIGPIPPTESSWHVGALGERIVARTLAALPEGWHAFHSIPIGSSDADIDHVLVGPAGIFAINTKHHRGKSIWVAGKTLLVNGQRERHVSLAGAEAERLTKVLRARLEHVPSARSVIALVAPKQITVKEQPHDTTVVDARHLARWLARQPRSMDAEDVADVAAVLDDPATWRSTPVVDSHDLTTRFDALMARVRRAEVVHALWILALALGVFGGCWAFFSTALHV